MLNLKRLIDEAISHGHSKFSEVERHAYLLASDGEGYELEIICLDGWDDTQWKNYEPEYAITKTKGGKHD